jgi:long-chain acyl-CoA synthetase
MTDNIYTLLLSAAESCPEKEFLACDDRRFTFREALIASQKCASFLLSRGLEAGDRMLLNIGNVPEMMFSVFGALQIGAVPVLVNPSARMHELRSYVERTTPKLVVTNSENVWYYRDDRGRFFDYNNIIFMDDSVPEKSYTRIVSAHGPRGDFLRPGEQHPAVIIFTSAEDGVPGGAMITHRAVIETVHLSGEMQANEEDTTLGALPLFHAFGLTTSLFLPLYNRSRVRLVERFSVKKTAEELMDGSITVFCGVPIMFGALARQLEKTEGLSRVRAWVSGGEAISPALQGKMKSRYGIEIRQGYGLTEASPIVTWNSMHFENRHGSVGRAMPYNTVKIIRNGSAAGDGEEGEVFVKGANVVPGYYSDPGKTSAAINDGWLRTGDIALRDADGYFYIRGRCKEMVLRNGFNVYPREVERILSLHPDAERVEVTGIIDLREDYSGRDSLEAVVRRKKGAVMDEKSFREWCADNISSYKIPDVIRIN